MPSILETSSISSLNNIIYLTALCKPLGRGHSPKICLRTIELEPFSTVEPIAVKVFYCHGFSKIKYSAVHEDYAAFVHSSNLVGLVQRNATQPHWTPFHTFRLEKTVHCLRFYHNYLYVGGEFGLLCYHCSTGEKVINQCQNWHRNISDLWFTSSKLYVSHGCRISVFGFLKNQVFQF